jgi:acetyl coenzyme A synthetase (ADP forming)-like protein
MPKDLERLLAPSSVAVVGASEKTGSVGGEILRNLVRCGFAGELLAVNPKYDAVNGIRCYRSVRELPEPVDLAVLAINRDLVLDAVSECARRGITNLVIITAGFKESGPSGIEREAALRSMIEEFGLNVVGPNCMGIINSSAVKMNASFSRWFPHGGEIAFISQSGSLGETLLECFEDAGLGVSLFVNLGNRAGLTENDFLATLKDEASCKAVFLYLESFAEPRGFRRLVEQIARTKPVVVLKAGRTEAGAAAVASHTGSLASPDAVVDAFLTQSGALRVATIGETLTALRALERGALPAGNRTVILTNAGGAGIIAADACERMGIEVAAPSEDAKRELAEFLPPEAGLGNPIDMIATAGAEDYRRSLEVTLREADAAIVIFRPPLVLRDRPDAVAEGVISVAAASPDKPVLVSTLSEQVTDTVRRFRAARLPVYAMPETAVDALAVLDRARRIREAWNEEEPVTTYDGEAARRVLDRVLSKGRHGVFFDEGAEILAAYGINVCPFVYVEGGRLPEAWVGESGFPLAAKIDAPALFHRFEQGAVITDIGDEGSLAAAVAELQGVIRRVGLSDARILLQRMLSGRELIYGLERDQAFGPVAMFGVGGTYVEAFQDVVFAVAPIRAAQAERTVHSIRSFRLLGAFRGQPAVDLDSLAHILSAIGQLGLDHPEIQEVDLNPVIADSHGAAAVDILIKL